MSTFVAGHLVPVVFTKTGGTAATLNIKEHSLDLSVLLHDVTGYSQRGVRARIAGPFDVAGRVVCDLDLDEPPYADPPLITPGTSGLAQWGVSEYGLKYFQLPLIVEKLHFSGSTEKEMMWDADMKCNSLAGSVVYPSL